jgi:hypothetical protein
MKNTVRGLLLLALYGLVSFWELIDRILRGRKLSTWVDGKFVGFAREVPEWRSERFAWWLIITIILAGIFSLG